MIARETRERIKKGLSSSPLLFRLARAGYLASSNVQREVMSLGRMVPYAVSKLTGQGENLWRDELPVQAVSRRTVPAFTIEGLLEYCRARNLVCGQGGDSIYLPPETWAAGPLAFLQADYPAGCGLKISRNAGGSDGYYMTGRDGRRLSRLMSFPHRKQVLTFNYLHAHGLAPRLFDLIELSGEEGGLHTAYVIEHVTGEPLRAGDLDGVVAKLKALEQDGCLRLISAAGWSGIDFEAPDGNGNVIRCAATGRPLYVDVHNFVLDKYESYLTAVARTAAEDSHFGERRHILGGAYLYQEVPGLNLPAKRSPRSRMIVMDELFRTAGLEISGRAVLDIGCNLGLMGAEYLRRGARWLHGWDMPEVASASRKVLLAIGCTRFSHTSGRIGPDTALAHDLPEHLKGLAADDIIINYLAIRGHIGWLPALAAVPWRYMVYEGHQDDGVLDGYIEELNRIVPVRLLAQSQIADGVSTARDVAIIERLA